MIHPHSEIVRVDPEIGYGMRTTRPIPAGTIVWALDRFDLVFSAAERESLSPAHRELLDHFGYLEASGRWILCWDGGRYVNHSCRPAMRGIGTTAMIAVRDLAAGDEITCDYAECNIDPLPCRCGAVDCRGEIRAEDLLQRAAEWDAELRTVLAAAGRVPQPLLPYLAYPKEIEPVLRGARPAPSLATVYADRAPRTTTS